MNGAAAGGHIRVEFLMFQWLVCWFLLIWSCWTCLIWSEQNLSCAESTGSVGVSDFIRNQMTLRFSTIRKWCVSLTALSSACWLLIGQYRCWGFEALDQSVSRGEVGYEAPVWPTSHPGDSVFCLHLSLWQNCHRIIRYIK